MHALPCRCLTVSIFSACFTGNIGHDTIAEQRARNNEYASQHNRRSTPSTPQRD